MNYKILDQNFKQVKAWKRCIVALLVSGVSFLFSEKILEPNMPSYLAIILFAVTFVGLSYGAEFIYYLFSHRNK